MVLKAVVRQSIEIAIMETESKSYYLNCVHYLIKLKVLNERKDD